MPNQKGSIFKYIFFIVVILLVLSYFSFDLKEFMNSEMVVKNWNYIKDFFINLWDDYLKVAYEWILDLFGPFIFDTITGIQEGTGATTPELGLPELPGI